MRLAPVAHAPRPVFPLLVAAALLSGCGALNPLQDVVPGPAPAWSSPPAQPTPAAALPAPAAAPVPRDEAGPVRRDAEGSPEVRVEAPILAGAAALSRHLRTAGTDWLGTPYRYGGESERGIDCSGFTRALLREALGLELTRSTATQVAEGRPVEKEALLPGDLVFFRRRGTRHVGVYLGDGAFIHASSSNGVIVSRLDEGYYERHYWTARRVLDDPRRFVPPGALTAGLSPPRRSDEPRSVRPAALPPPPPRADASW
ncbi:MAG: NlpC/P60 family protein [Rubricoccaceae bacterium]|nr:NlpC/P60 family protein [Rubricoccaceae bacterium]